MCIYLYSTLFRKSQMALKAQNSDSSAEEADEFNFSVSYYYFLFVIFYV